MNTKSRKKHKSADDCEAKPNIGGSEVFVLPPDLLEKLGIKLDSIVSTETQTTGTISTTDLADKSLLSKQSGEKECFKTPKAVTKKNESSILETASLMKESVFLSPTFVPTVANVIPGEFEFVGSVEKIEENKAVVQNEVEKSSNYEAHMNTKLNDLSCNLVGTMNIIQNNLLKTNQVNDTIGKCMRTENDYDSLETSHDIAGRSVHKNKHVTEIENESFSNSIHKNYAHSSNESREIKDDLNIVSRKKKIKVINEEVVKVSKLRPRRNSLIPNLNNNVLLTPVSKDMILPTVKKNKNVLCSTKAENTKIAQKVDSFNDIGRAETDIRQSDTFCELVVNDVVEHVNVLYVNEIDKLNDSVHGTGLMGEYPKIDNNCEVGTSLSKLNNKQDTNFTIVHDVRSSDNLNLNTKNQIEEHDTYDFLDVNDAYTNIHKKNVRGTKTAVDICDMIDLDNVCKMVDQCELENLEAVLYSEEYSNVDLNSKSAICNEPTDIDIMQMELFCGKDVGENTSNVKSDSVYVSGQVHTKQEQNSSINLSFENSDKEFHKSKIELRKSKLCIQGVEKPGGEYKSSSESMKAMKDYEKKDEQTYSKDKRQSVDEMPGSSQFEGEIEKSIKKDNVLKTYERDKKNIRQNVQLLKEFVEVYNDMDEINKYDNVAIDLNAVFQTEDFCLCGDFGQLKYYDHDNISYEHIHFWNRNAVTCDPDLIFSIYNVDDNINNDDTKTSIIDSIADENEKSLNKICWSEINSESIHKPKYEEDYYVNDKNKNATENDFETNNINIICAKVEHLDVKHNVENFTRENSEEKSDHISVNPCLKITEINKNDKLIGREEISQCELDNKDQNINMTAKRNAKKRNPRVVANDVLSPNLEEPEKCKPSVEELHGSLNPDEPRRRKYSVVTKEELKSTNTEQGRREPRVVAKKELLAPKPEQSRRRKPSVVAKEESQSPNPKQPRRRKPSVVAKEELQSPNPEQSRIRKPRVVAKEESQSPNSKQFRIRKPSVVTKEESQSPNLEQSRIRKPSVVAKEESQSPNPEHSRRRKRSVADKKELQSPNPEQSKTCKPRVVVKEELQSPHSEQPSRRKISEVAKEELQSPNPEQSRRRKRSVFAKEKSQSPNLEQAKRRKHSLVAKEEIQSSNPDESRIRKPSVVAKEELQSLNPEQPRRRKPSEVVKEELQLPHPEQPSKRKISEVAKEEIQSSNPDESRIRKPSVVAKEELQSLNPEQPRGRKPSEVVKEELQSPHPEQPSRRKISKVAKEELQSPNPEQPRRRKPSEVVKEELQSPHPEQPSKRKISEVAKEELQSPKPEQPRSRKPSVVAKEELPNIKTTKLDKDIKCGVCNQILSEADWEDHLSLEHSLIAWQAGHAFDFRDKDLILKIKEKLKKDGVLKCRFCNVEMTVSKRYLLHVEECWKMKSGSDPKIITGRSVTKRESVGESTSDNLINCGVCKNDVQSSEWLVHICDQHNYLAWKNGEAPLNLDDADLLVEHLLNIIKEHGPIICSQCGLDRKYGEKRVKLFLQHLKVCSKGNNKGNKEAESSESVAVPKSDHCDKEIDVRCGVCGTDVPGKTWIYHIGKEHDYLAWKEGENALNLKDEEEVKHHLYTISKEHDGLVCSKCGIKRKYVKKYLSHIKECDGPKKETSVSEVEVLGKTEFDVSMCEEGEVKCGVCGTDVSSKAWIDHIGKEHDYLAWKEGENILDIEDEEEVKHHLYTINKMYDGLLCFKCGIKRKYVKSFLSHVKHCDGTGSTNYSLNESLLMNQSCLSDIGNASQTNDISLKEDRRKRRTKCGVCLENVLSHEWFSHIEEKHNYIAWKVGEQPVKSEKEIEDHLHSIIKEYGHLSCSKCGSVHKYEESSVESYLAHVNSCEKKALDLEKEVVICGVCEKDFKRRLWIKHIQAEHNYLAWIHGETPLAMDDVESIRVHLFSLEVDVFKCSKCGVKKKYPKSFITHIFSCCNPESNFKTEEENDSSNAEGTCQCAVCSEIVPMKQWNKHAMDKHYNIAWRVGDDPIDLKSVYGTEKCLKIYKEQIGKLVCKICGITRVSLAGFYAHILACGKTDEELEEYQIVCEICNNKYICIYKNQHMQAHKEQEYAKQRKLAVKTRVDTAQSEPDVPSGRRRAAIKANSVIEKLNSSNAFNYTCPTCGLDTDSEKKFARHKCVPATFVRDFESSSDESEDSEDSKDFSAEEEAHEITRRKKNKESMVQAKIPEVPFKYNEVTSYTAQNKKDFYDVQFTKETLFPQWLACEYELFSEDQIGDYLPTMEKSCQINLDKEWTTFERFEAKETTKGYTIFVGGSVQCLSWIPPRVGDDEGSNYLAVSNHRGSDCPRYNYDDLNAYPGLIQIWDFGDFRIHAPKLAMGLVHDYGTIWAMEWCPSGTRDAGAEDATHTRLGLLAVACSDGLVYILSVPHPSTLAERGKYVKLKAVAELRLSSGSDRRRYQATAMTWSKQKGHSMIAVGYSDGTTALYDLNNTSPLLQCTENGTSIFYPYHDEKEHNISVTDMDTYPGSGTICSASMGGVAGVVRPGAALARLVSHSATTCCRFAPGWPSIMLAVEEAVGGQGANELDWYGCGRRLGPMRITSGCLLCGRALLYSPPMLRTLQALPPYSNIRKQNILGIRAQPLEKKRPKTNDELAMKVEPLTYDEVVGQYGIEVFFVDASEKNNSINTVKEQWSERFPLADVTALSFCAAPAHHDRAAAALHAGFVLLFSL